MILHAVRRVCAAVPGSSASWRDKASGQVGSVAVQRLWSRRSQPYGGDVRSFSSRKPNYKWQLLETTKHMHSACLYAFANNELTKESNKAVRGAFPCMRRRLQGDGRVGRRCYSRGIKWKNVRLIPPFLCALLDVLKPFLTLCRARNPRSDFLYYYYLWSFTSLPLPHPDHPSFSRP